MGSIRMKKSTMLLCLLPGVVWYSLILLVPVILAGYYGFFDWSGGVNKIFVGIENYIHVLKDSVFILSLKNNLFLVVVCLVGQIGLAFVFAFMLNSRHIRWKGLHRTMSYFPAVLSAVVVGFVWSFIYDYNYGLLNAFLELIGQGDKAQAWLSNNKIAMVLVAVPLVWQYIGYYMIIIMSAMSSVDPQIFEMSEIDGASGWKKAVYITLPLIKNTLIVCVTLCIAGNMKIFDLIYSLTGGGPGNTTSVMAMYAYKSSFLSYKMGYGSAMSIVILIISLMIVGGSQAFMRYFTKEDER
ncbi:MAG: sugar ABC transporter permease [Eubacteriales bacterium]|nr:sugar ABC transporter permease [Eubacteriales bacterium]